MEVSGKSYPVDFYIGFYNQAVISYLKYKLITDLKFGMRVGDSDVNFFILPLDLNDVSIIDFKLLEITYENDPKYTDLILI